MVNLESVELTCYTTLVNLTAFRRTYARSSPSPLPVSAFAIRGCGGNTPLAAAVGGLASRSFHPAKAGQVDRGGILIL
jgi:hypothetical protein